MASGKTSEVLKEFGQGEQLFQQKYVGQSLQSWKQSTIDINKLNFAIADASQWPCVMSFYAERLDLGLICDDNISPHQNNDQNQW